ncbi:hypothetical protein EJ110_NYTH02007 [Nymphaea thermarum]|nr:hypothetical protein EJ110_NYTH02007 [Nymphaea thermarum]
MPSYNQVNDPDGPHKTRDSLLFKDSCREREKTMYTWWRFRSPALSALRAVRHLPSSRSFFHSQATTNGALLLLRERPVGASSLGLLSRRSGMMPSELGPRSPLFPFTLQINQVRDFSSKERKRTKVTPVTSKLKKIKMKAYSSYKFRFRTMNDGNIRRWREGKRHNAHLKSKKAKRRLRKPAIVPAAYAKVMKKLNFCG